MPTAFVASAGKGRPVITLLAEFDALPGLSQAAIPARKPIVVGGAGHACGHHLFGTGSVAAGIAVSAWLTQRKGSGTSGLARHPFTDDQGFRWTHRRTDRSLGVLAPSNVPMKASARHILVTTEETCLDLKQKITDGADFAALAKEHSTCPSGQRGGELGSFGPGQMVPEFDKVVFKEDVGVVHGPVKTDFGYHLLEVTKRE